MPEAEKSFSKWRSFLWPIYRWELKKFLPMAGIFFLIAFISNALRSYKDTFIMTASQSGAEAIPFIKVWAVLPAAFLMTYLFTRLANRFDRETVFYMIMSIFLGFFFLFGFVLYPAQEFLHPHALADQLQNWLPDGFKGLIALLRNWTFTLFYVMADLWSSAIFAVLFWGFANEVTSVGEAKRYYGIFAAGGNLATILSGQAAVFFSTRAFFSWIPYGSTPWDQSILFMTLAVLVAGIAAMSLFRWLNCRVIRIEELPKANAPAPEKIKMSLRENFLYLAKSKYLICIALIVVAYNLAINLVEIVWKNQIKALYPNPSDYNIYMGEVMTIMAILATIAGLLTTGNLIRRYSWTSCALITPAIVGATGLIFFSFVLFGSSIWFGLAPLAMSVFLGAIQNCLSRAAKYTVFDATKEISFIPLSAQCKLKGKAAIDGVGSRLGKSGGSVIHQGLLLIFSTVSSSSPYVAAIFLAIIGIWWVAVKSLGKQFDALATAKTNVHVPDAAEPPAEAPART